MFIEIFFKILLFKGGVIIYAEHCIFIYIYIYIYIGFFSILHLLLHLLSILSYVSYLSTTNITYFNTFT